MKVGEGDSARLLKFGVNEEGARNKRRQRKEGEREGYTGLLKRNHQLPSLLRKRS